MTSYSDPSLPLIALLLLFVVPVVGLGTVVLSRLGRRVWRGADAETRGRWSNATCGMIVAAGLVSMMVAGIAFVMMLQEFDRAFTH